MNLTIYFYTVNSSFPQTEAYLTAIYQGTSIVGYWWRLPFGFGGSWYLLTSLKAGEADTKQGQQKRDRYLSLLMGSYKITIRSSSQEFTEPKFIQKKVSTYIVTLAIRAFWQDISHSQDTVMWDIHLSNRTSQMTQSKHIATVYICSYHNSWRDVWTHANAIHFHV